MVSGPSRFQKMLRVQQMRAWDIEQDLDWTSLDVSKSLVPLATEIGSILALSPAELQTLSQLIGLMAVQTISQHETILGFVRNECWSRPLATRATSSDFNALGEQFFREEEKHSYAFAHYVTSFADRLKISKTSLQSILPRFEPNSWITSLFRLNCVYSARAVWWMVMITEEESLELYRHIAPHAQGVDPLFYRLNELHYEEENRHLSYAPMMLRLLQTGGSSLSQRLKSLDFLISEALYRIWILLQFRRVRRTSRLARQHPFFASIQDIITKFDSLSLKQKYAILQSALGRGSIFNPRRHPSIQAELRRSGDKQRWIS